MSQFVKMPDGEYIPFDMWYRYTTHTLFSEDFLGTELVQNKISLSFNEARELVIKLKLNSNREWRKYSKSGKRPYNISSCPDVTYKNKWIGWGDFLGTGNVYKKDFLSFTKARIFVKKLKLSNVKEWKEYCKSGKKPDNIPHNPNIVYKDKWKGWGDFLGTGNIYRRGRDKVFSSFEEIKKSVKELELKNYKEWQEYCKSGNKSNNMPTSPNTIYKDKGWISWGDFLGTKNVHKKDFLSFAKARIFVKKLELKNRKEWREYCKSGNKPSNVPSHPNIVYKDKWINWYDFLGTKKETK